MKQIEKAALSTALPSCSRSRGLRTLVVAVRASARATIATTPSISVSTNTGISEKCIVISASSANRTPSAAYRIGSRRRGARWSTRATTNGAANAGSTIEVRKNTAEPSALPVRR